MSIRIKQIFLFCGLTSLILLLLTTWIYPYCIIRDTGQRNGQLFCCQGQFRWWHPSSLPVPITLNREGSRGAPGEATLDAVRRAMQTWNRVNASFFEFSDAGLTDQNFAANDGINIVIFDNEGINFAQGTTTLAFSRTMTTNDGRGYRAIDSDMVFNGRDWNWVANPQGQNDFDIESTTLHEFGHHLGLGHAGGGRDLANASSGCGPVIRPAVMYFATSSGSITRQLHPDDIAGITNIYPKWFIRGRVTHGVTGLPVPQAEVQLNGTVSTQDTIVVNRLRSDDSGAFSGALIDSSFSVLVPAFGFETSEEIEISFPQPDTMEVDFIIQPLATNTLTGTVRDRQTGRAISATVELFVGDQVYQQTSTGADGRYEFKELPVTSVTTNYGGMRVTPELPYPLTFHDDRVIILADRPTEVFFELEPAEIFIVDDDGGAAIESFVINSLDSLGVSYVSWDIAARGKIQSELAFFPQKPVIWLTGNQESEFLTEDELVRLRTHLSEGGSLLLSGENIAEHLASRESTFLAEVLHTGWAANSRDPILNGVAGDPVGGGLDNIAIGGGDGARNQKSQDVLLPDSIAIATIMYDIPKNEVAAVRLDEAIAGVAGSRLAFFGFGVEAVNGLPPGFSSREQLLANTLDWLEGVSTSVAAATGSGRIETFSLLPNYPNPFNGQTIIRFQIPPHASGERVSLEIIDMMGREVKTLVDRTLKAGEHTIAWQGRNDAGTLAPTGLYFYRFKAGEFQQVRKLLYVK